MGYESVAHEAEGRVGYRLRGYEGERNNCFSKIQLVGQKNNETEHLSLVKARHQSFFTAKTLQNYYHTKMGSNKFITNHKSNKQLTEQ